MTIRECIRNKVAKYGFDVNMCHIVINNKNDIHFCILGTSMEALSKDIGLTPVEEFYVLYIWGNR